MLHRLVFSLLAALIFFSYVYAADTTRPQVGVYYFPGWYRTGGAKAMPPYDRQSDWSEWRGAILRAAKPRPLAGFSNDADPKLWDYYIDWMTGNGIDFIAFDWYYNAGQEYLEASLAEGFLGASKSDQIKFCLHWCNHGGSWWKKPLDQSTPSLLEMLDFVQPKYLARKNYLRIDGRPVFMIYDIDILLRFGGPQKVREALAAVRERARPLGGLYLVGVYSYAHAPYIGRLAELGFDAFCAYNYVGQRGPNVRWDSKAYPYREVTRNLIDNLYPFLHRVGEEKNIPYWPTAFSGWDDRPRAGLRQATVLTDNTPEEFGRLFRAAMEHVNPKSPVVIVEAWNEWGEGAAIEPSKEHGFGYLDEIHRAVEARGRQTPGTNSAKRLPTATEIQAWSILSPDELEIARANEKKPWPLQDVIWNEKGHSADVSNVSMPWVFDLRTIPLDQIELNQLTVVERNEQGLLLKTEGSDANLVLPKVSIPMRQIQTITLDAVAENPPGDLQFELFWTTALMPTTRPFASVVVPYGPRLAVRTADIATWKATGTPLERLRIDIDPRPGIRVRLKQVKLSDR